MLLQFVSPRFYVLGKDFLRSKAYTAGILLQARVVKALLFGQSLTPAIALFGLERSVLLRLLGFLNLLFICFLHVQAHPIVDKRRFRWLLGRVLVTDSSEYVESPEEAVRFVLVDDEVGRCDERTSGLDGFVL